MDDLIGFIIVFVIFVLGPLLEQMKRKNQPPPRQRREPPPRKVYTPERPKPSARQAERAESQSAATMLPEELWTVLTGQPLPAPARPKPKPLPPDVEEESLEDEEEQSVEDVSIEVRRGRFEEAVSLEELPRRFEPVVVSMETVPDPRIRHEAFHKRLEQPAPVAVVPRQQWLQGPDDVRRAFVLQAILGPPKGLE